MFIADTYTSLFLKSRQFASIAEIIPVLRQENVLRKLHWAVVSILFILFTPKYSRQHNK